VQESAGTAGGAAATGLGLGVGGRSSPSLSIGSKLRSASITGLDGGGWVSGIVSARGIAGEASAASSGCGRTGLALDQRKQPHELRVVS
jgi:hypothetical protein